MSTPTSTLPVRITKSVVDRLHAPTAGQAFTRDAELKGFAVRITTSGAKSFILEKRIDGKVKPDAWPLSRTDSRASKKGSAQALGSYCYWAQSYC